MRVGAKEDVRWVRRSLCFRGLSVHCTWSATIRRVITYFCLLQLLGVGGGQANNYGTGTGRNNFPGFRVWCDEATVQHARVVGPAALLARQVPTETPPSTHRGAKRITAWRSLGPTWVDQGGPVANVDRFLDSQSTWLAPISCTRSNKASRSISAATRVRTCSWLWAVRMGTIGLGVRRVPRTCGCPASRSQSAVQGQCRS